MNGLTSKQERRLWEQGRAAKAMDQRLPRCVKCTKPVLQDPVNAEGSLYHRECFACDVCGRKISTQYRRNGNRIMCAPCFKKDLPQCPQCSRSVSGEAITAGGNTYHRTCFVCGTCRQPISARYSLDDKDNLVCDKCHEAALPRCVKCNCPVKGNFVTTDGGPYHQECFSCSACHCAISGSYFATNVGHLLCEGCHKAENPPKYCFFCCLPIDGQCVIVDSKSCHKSCFRCCSCSHPIEGRYLKSKRGYLCEGCQPVCSVCRGPLSGYPSIQLDGKEVHVDCFRCSICGVGISEGHYKADWNMYRCPTCHANSLQAHEDAKEACKSSKREMVKKRTAEEFKLTWRPELVPCSRETLLTLGLPDSRLPHGAQVCVCYNKQTRCISCAPAARPDSKAVVNVSYLACALQVLRATGREPQFSLDPKDPHDLGGELLTKRFYPDWLARTVAGEVLFQADYTLKELCFGDQALPGLTSVFDDNQALDCKSDEETAARQWFTLRRAGVVLAADGACAPHVEMAVETRRLVRCESGYKDAAYTAPDDPMVRQAAAVNARFSEVTAQIPVVAELVALARAVVLAKFLLESGCRCDEDVLRHYKLPQTPEGIAYAMEIPALSKDRASSSVSHDSQQGRLVFQQQRRSMHGGVDLALPTKKVPSRMEEVRLLKPNALSAPLPLFVQPSAARAA